MLTRFSLRIDTSTLCVFDPTCLRHRLRDPADWWTVPQVAALEINSRNALLFELGSDGVYDVEVRPQVLEKAVSGLLRCPSGSLYFGDIASADGVEPSIEQDVILRVDPGDYTVRVARGGPFSLVVAVIRGADVREGHERGFLKVWRLAESRRGRAVPSRRPGAAILERPRAAPSAVGSGGPFGAALRRGDVDLFLFRIHEPSGALRRRRGGDPLSAVLVIQSRLRGCGRRPSEGCGRIRRRASRPRRLRIAETRRCPRAGLVRARAPFRSGIKTPTAEGGSGASGGQSVAVMKGARAAGIPSRSRDARQRSPL